ncbi:nuclear transport factor 2 family protein [Labrys wisconsinensis]|jgi:hypothetical protein|uniref:SnoaL-like domain-containing protein n=1 Tax=Labrys wisconsinensis TaxID=425677 RepID=A0ABU0JKD7_9HYPH|nr:nuclear transport factor 2 family protein [Labrys wisconsinensis]MDQ0474745.1 hypothetical protein [Labrys wisconsinensis]
MSMTEDEIRRRNVAAVEALYEAERRRTIEDWARLWHPHGRQSFHLSTDVPPVVGREALVRATRRKFEVRPPYGIGVVTEPFADPSRVLARLHLTFGEGIRPTDLWCIFTFDHEGLITEIAEMVDTANSYRMPA